MNKLMLLGLALVILSGFLYLYFFYISPNHLIDRIRYSGEDVVIKDVKYIAVYSNPHTGPVYPPYNGEHIALGSIDLYSKKDTTVRVFIDDYSNTICGSKVKSGLNSIEWCIGDPAHELIFPDPYQDRIVKVCWGSNVYCDEIYVEAMSDLTK